ncbi:MAG: leucyl/phenylalanyl-tRNA--protein transferase [Limisphaerales bacterium]
MRETDFPALLGRELWFPHPDTAASDGDFDGLVAIGGDLSCERLDLAYRSGIFPWSVNPITWWSPNPRGIIPIDHEDWPRSLRKLIRKAPFRISIDTAFEEVIRNCADSRRPGCWITPEFIAAYTALHQSGIAHSLECWQENELVGGIYGIAIGGLFTGESMFHKASNASKIALFMLLKYLRGRGFTLFDTQMVTDTTAKLGAVEISREDYLKALDFAVNRDVSFS